MIPVKKFYLPNEESPITRIHVSWQIVSPWKVGGVSEETTPFWCWQSTWSSTEAGQPNHVEPSHGGLLTCADEDHRTPQPHCLSN